MFGARLCVRVIEVMYMHMCGRRMNCWRCVGKREEVVSGGIVVWAE
jgi:hypothetical protein